MRWLWIVLLAAMPWMAYADETVELVVLADDTAESQPADAALQAAEANDENPAEGAVLVLQVSDGAKVEGGEIKVELSGEKPSNYWVGLDCVPASDALRAQLGLEGPGGLVVRQVVDDSPAKAAGLQPHDVLVGAKIGEKQEKISGVGEFSKLIQSAEGKPITLTVFRAGKSQEIAVTTAERPAAKAEEGDARRRHRGGRDRGERSEHGGPPGRGPGGFSFRMAGPVVVKLGEEMGKLPDDMKITITKSGNEPAEVAVSQGEKSWTVKDAELEKLPPEVRGSLAKFLGMGLLSKLHGPPPDFLKNFGGHFGRGFSPWGAPGRFGHGAARPHDGDKGRDHGDKARPHHGHDRAEAACPHCGAKKKAEARQHRRHHHQGRFAHLHHHRGPRHFLHARFAGPRFGARPHQPPFGGPHAARFGRPGFGHGHSHGHGFGPGHGHAPCPICQVHQHHHPAPQFGFGGPRFGAAAAGTGFGGGRVEALLTRIERLVGQHTAGGPPASGFGPGGFGPPRPHAGPAAGGFGGPGRRPHPPAEGGPGPHHPPSDAGQLRDTIRRLEEQQEKMAKAIQDLTEAVEKQQKK